jgi:hypothetical protein
MFFSKNNHKFCLYLLFLKIPIEIFLSYGDPFSIVPPVMIKKRVLSFPSTTGIGNDQASERS